MRTIHVTPSSVSVNAYPGHPGGDVTKVLFFAAAIEDVIEDRGNNAPLSCTLGELRAWLQAGKPMPAVVDAPTLSDDDMRALARGEDIS